MKIPDSLLALTEQGLIEEVLRPLRSGKEAQVYLVKANGEERVAKIYKEANNRSFKNRSQYTEGRKVRNSRDQRAMRKQTRYGKAQDESAWRSAEADIIYRLRDAGVAVPQPFGFEGNVLIMELVRDASGEPAPRLADLNPSPEEARSIFDKLLANTVKMLCAGVVHGDLSEFNVLIGPEGPIIIDFPQALDPAKNRNAKRILIRDVANLERFLGRATNRRQYTRYGSEMWSLYEKQLLSPESVLTGRAPKKASPKNEGDAILEEMLALEQEARKRREALGLPPPRARVPVFKDPKPKPKTKEQTKEQTRPSKRKRRKRKPENAIAPQKQGAPEKRRPVPTTTPSVREAEGTKTSTKDTVPKKRRRRRRGAGAAAQSDGKNHSDS